MSRLPALLQAWHPWLSLFPADLAAPLGELMLRLHPQIGPLRSAPARADHLPEGVGSIVQRGPYERMLISEWAYADAEPDEFLRRAGSGELMFTGPEPAARQRSRRCVALFDAGPAQLGEPRLLHLALFILLARRAEEAGALFEWGIVQVPGVLHNDSGTAGIHLLLKARRLDGADDAALAQWSGCVDHGADDLWIIGARPLPAPGARGQVGIRRSMLAEQLDVTLNLQGAVRRLALDLPPATLGTRLLRQPFEPLAIIEQKRQSEGRPSQLQAPRFAANGDRLAVAQFDGGVRVYQIPRKPKQKTGKARRYAKHGAGNELGAGVFGKSLGRIVSDGETISFISFPSPAFGSAQGMNVARPGIDQFRVPANMPRWIDTFFFRLLQKTSSGQNDDGHVLATDLDGNLGWWSGRSKLDHGTTVHSPIVFRVLDSKVIGAAQFDRTLRYARKAATATDILAWTPQDGSTKVARLPHAGRPPGWYGNGQRHLVALKRDTGNWLVGDSVDWVDVEVDERAKVLGVAACTRHAIWGLVVRSADKKSIYLSGHSHRVLITSEEPIGQASVDPVTGAIAWIGATSLRVNVQAIDADLPCLQVNADEVQHAG
jgi:hypothetical protein